MNQADNQRFAIIAAKKDYNKALHQRNIVSFPSSLMHSPAVRIGLSLALLTTFFIAGAAAQELTPRRPLPKSVVKVMPLSGRSPSMNEQGDQYRLIVKFRDEIKMRAVQNRLEQTALKDMGSINNVIQRFGMTFSRLIKLSEDKLQSMEARAEAHSGIAQPDLAGIMIVQIQDTSPATLEAAGQALQALDEVEFAFIETLYIPPPADILPTTPLLVNMQTYRGPNPGMNVDYALSLGYTGDGIKISDCEYGWNAEHEDLNDIDIHIEPGQTIHPEVFANGWDSHGTAVLGETSGVVNSYGVSGLAPDASIYTYPEWTIEESSRRTTAVVNAIANSSPGDVVLLEMQTIGDTGYVPAEYNPAVWTAVKNGTDAGVIVVAAAGNGNQNLDSEYYDSYRARGDSGAIIVGAGTENTNHDKLSFSTYGSRVNVQGWGSSVFTLGYGDFAEYGGDKNQRYTSNFSGTSSASPFIASAAAILQEAALQLLGRVLTPFEMRDLLIRTGIPQGNGGHIGPLPNIEDALSALSDIDDDGYIQCFSWEDPDIDNCDCDDEDTVINPETFWYQDKDGDTFGNYSLSLQQCSQPTGPPDYVLDNNDYDDNDGTIGAPVKIDMGTVYYYSLLQDAYNAAADDDTIKVISVTFIEDLSVNRNISVTLQGGYDGSYSSNTGATTLQGKINISNGIVAIENFHLQ